MELRDDGENRGSSEGRQTQGTEKVENGVQGVRQGRSSQSRLAWMGDGKGSEEANEVGMCSPI